MENEARGKAMQSRGMPPEVIKELGYRRSSLTKGCIVSVVSKLEEEGYAINIDNVLISVYNEFGITPTRLAIRAHLRRLVKEGDLEKLDTYTWYVRRWVKGINEVLAGKGFKLKGEVK